MPTTTVLVLRVQRLMYKLVPVWRSSLTLGLSTKWMLHMQVQRAQQVLGLRVWWGLC